MIYVTGDYHGGLESHKISRHFFPEGRTLTKDDYLIVAGDFGLYWFDNPRGRDALATLDSMPWTTLFVDGNHEGFSNLYSLSIERWNGGDTSILPDTGIRWLRRGQVFTIDGHTVLAMGGATSVDKEWRQDRVSWFEEELPSQDEKDACLASLGACGWNVDYVVTHTCPTSMVSRALYPDSNWMCPDHDHLTDFLDLLDQKLTFKRWYFGHFHHDRDIDETHTLLYQCVVPLGEPVEEHIELFKQRENELCS